MGWISAVFLLLVAFVVGLSLLFTEPEWWVKGLGLLTSLASVGIVVLVISHLRRPVRDPASEPLDANKMAEWADTLARHGVVEVGFNKSRVVVTFAVVLGMFGAGLICPFLLGPILGSVIGLLLLAMCVFAALLPHFEAVTARGPAVRIDTRGITIARWYPLVIPWREVLGVDAHRSTRRQFNVLVAVSPDFFEEYLRSRPRPLRFTDGMYASFTGCGFSIPATIAAAPRSLAAWLDGEAQQRNPAGWQAPR